MRKTIRIPLLALGLSVVFTGTALATLASSGFHPTKLSQGTISEPVHFNTDEVKLQTKGSVDVVTATVTLDPQGSSGWHAHPGVVLVTVALGSVVQYDEHCSATGHALGSTFVESGDDAGLVRNETTNQAVVYVTYIVPTGSALRIDKADPGCTLP
jgi:quercetin dioxygenase-like cupin family protein